MSARSIASKTAAARRGGSRFLLAVLGVLLLAASAAFAATEHDETLTRVRALTRGGATQLALKLIDQNQPDISEPESWIAWERERYALYRQQRDWAGLVARADTLREILPVEFLHWSMTEAAQAELNTNHPEAARRLLRELLLSGKGSDAEQSDWRQLVIRSYLVEDNLGDALTALRLYREDFEARSDAWRQLEATILIRAGQAKEAYARVGGIKTHEGRLLALTAALRGGVLPPATVLARAEALAEETRNKPALNHQVWILMAEAALRANKPMERMYALERALDGARRHVTPEHLFVVSADDLWGAYDRYTENIGNAARLLVGKDEAWLKKATAYKRDDAMQARAFYAFLLTHAARGETRALAAHRLADSLIEDGRAEVLRALFAASRRYPDLARVPEYARFRMAELALGDFDIDFAARVMQGLEKAPNGEDQDSWSLRRARVLIYGGKYSDATGLLNSLLADKDKISDAFAERYLQVVFDLQSAGQHIKAIALLDTLYARLDNPRTRREILYWIAESRAGLGQYQTAGELYLRSATFNHTNGGDMWGQTARYHAAEALGKAGLTQDARAVYQNLLKFTEDPRQRAVIERNIQQLWLTEKRFTTP